jgi:ubiquinone/menaquinone biosynthesis C-methylase UbiE
MADKDHEGLLGAAYGAKTSSDVASVYDAWASNYDRQMVEFGYRHPTIGLALTCRHLPPASVPVLDVGAGTGLLGELLAIVDYPHVEALDISEGMLAIAAKKGCYKALHRADLMGSLPFPDGAYASVTAVGVFTTGHVGANGLDELVRITRRGGIIVLTCKQSLWQPAFSQRVERFSSNGKVTIVEQTSPYVSMPGEVGASKSLAVALRVTT